LESRKDFAQKLVGLLQGEAGDRIDLDLTRMIRNELFYLRRKSVSAEQNNLPSRFGSPYQSRENTLGIGSNASMFRRSVSQPKSDPHDPANGN
jgi:hypothetical protein